MFGNNLFNSNGAFPVFNNIVDKEENKVKLEHESYDIYVNGQYVGKKILISQNEKINDIVGYLKTQGFHNFSTETQGDHILIKADSDEAENIKQHFDVYLNIR